MSVLYFYDYQDHRPKNIKQINHIIQPTLQES